MTWAIEWSEEAERGLGKIDKSVRQRILAAVGKLADNPRPQTATPVVSSDEEEWRIRVGDYRVRYLVLDESVVVVVIRVAHRSKVYR